jgi:serine protease Do
MTKAKLMDGTVRMLGVVQVRAVRVRHDGKRGDTARENDADGEQAGEDFFSRAHGRIRSMQKKITILTMALLCLSCQAMAENVRETPVVKAVRKSAPCVVNIGTEQVLTLQQHPFWRQYGNPFSQPAISALNQQNQITLGTMKLQSVGSGIVVSPDGLVVTNAHVIGMASKIFVTLSDSSSYEADLLGTDNTHDLALLRIKTSKPLPYLTFAEDVLLGETVVSIGSPFGLQNSTSAGIISGTDRTFFTQPQIESLRGLIQTDASINQGSSGGALVNLEGNLVGMNVAMLQNAQGVGFAVPADRIRRMLQEYKKVRASSPPRAS